jgi:hypothetical protein
MTMPGVQMPHCAPLNSANACCSGWSSPSPSMVVTSAPSTWATGIRHEQTGSPSTSTVHAPHSPSPQPSFVPVSPRSSRSTSSKRLRPGTRSSRSRPFTLTRMPPP